MFVVDVFINDARIDAASGAEVDADLRWRLLRKMMLK